MSARNHYSTWLRELVNLRSRIELAESEQEVPSKLSNLVTYAAEEAAIQLQAVVANDGFPREAVA